MIPERDKTFGQMKTKNYHSIVALVFVFIRFGFAQQNDNRLGESRSADVKLEDKWRGNFVTGTNGIRVAVEVWDPEPHVTTVFVYIGSVISDSGACYAPPMGKFARCELRDMNGVIVPPLKGRSMEAELPSKVSTRNMLRQPSGALNNPIGFRTNSYPLALKIFKIKDVYDVKAEGNYTLTITPVIYRVGSNEEYLDRVDLQCVTNEVYLKPYVE